MNAQNADPYRQLALIPLPHAKDWTTNAILQVLAFSTPHGLHCELRSDIGTKQFHHDYAGRQQSQEKRRSADSDGERKRETQQ